MASNLLSVPSPLFFTLLSVQYQEVTNQILCKTANMKGGLFLVSTCFPHAWLWSGKTH